MWMLPLILLACSGATPTEAEAPEPTAQTAEPPGESATLPRNHVPPRPQHTPTDPELGDVFGAVVAKDGDKALALLEPLLASKPDSAEVNYFQGRALIMKQQFEEALPFLDKAISTDPTLAQAHKERAGALLSVRKIDDAVTSIDAYIKLVDDDAEAFYMRSFLHKYRGELEPAKVDALRACELEFEKACRVVGNLDYLINKRDKARAEAEAEAEAGAQGEAAHP